MTRHQHGISALVSEGHFAGKAVVVSRNVGCFLRLGCQLMKLEKVKQKITKSYFGYGSLIGLNLFDTFFLALHLLYDGNGISNAKQLIDLKQYHLHIYRLEAKRVT